MVFCRRIAYLSLLFILSLAGCIHPLPPTEPTFSKAPASWKQHRAKLEKQTTWHRQGPLLVRDKRHAKANRLTLDWKETPHERCLSFIGPLGTGRAVLHINAHTLTLRPFRGSPLQLKTPEQLQEYLPEWPLPLRAAPDWVRGLPDPQAQFIHWNANGTIHDFDSQGWHITYVYDVQSDTDITQPTKILIDGHDWSLTLTLHPRESA